MRTRKFIPGFTVDNYRGVWERPKTFGAPRAWAAGWLIAILYGVLSCIMAGRWDWLVYIGIGWFIGQGILVKLTQWDPDWDRLLRNCLMRVCTRKNPTYLRAG